MTTLIFSRVAKWWNCGLWSPTSWETENLSHSFEYFSSQKNCSLNHRRFWLQRHAQTHPTTLCCYCCETQSWAQDAIWRVCFFHVGVRLAWLCVCSAGHVREDNWHHLRRCHRWVSALYHCAASCLGLCRTSNRVQTCAKRANPSLALMYETAFVWSFMKQPTAERTTGNNE